MWTYLLHTLNTIERVNISVTPRSLPGFTVILPACSSSQPSCQASTALLLSLSISLYFLHFYINGFIQQESFDFAFFFLNLTSFIQHNYLRDLTMFSCVLVVDSFSLTRGIPLHGCSTVGFIH